MHRNRGGVEGVGFEDVCASGEVFPVNRADDFRLGQHQQVVIALDVFVPVGKTGAAIIGFFQLVTLDHGAHRPVKNQDAVGKRGVQLVGTVHG